MASVTFDHVGKTFEGGTTAVADFNLDIADGEFMVLLGPSGCGKSTALRMIAGLEEITEGEVRIGGRRVNEIDPRDRDVAMVFQSYALYPHWTVLKNIDSPLRARKYPVDGPNSPPRRLSPEERSERVAEAARILGLEDYLGRRPAALSGGQRQRVALARALVARPQVFLMDEPLSNLDAKLRTQTRAELIGLHDRLATTIVYVTHDQVEALTMADRVAIMYDGKIQQVGTPEEVYEQPANRFVAEFIGTPPMNVLSAAAVPSWAEGAPAGADVGVRPEHLVIGNSGESATVELVEWLGHESLIFCRLGAPDGEARSDAPVVSTSPRVVLRVEGAAQVSPGQEVSVAPAPGRVVVFDPSTGARLS